MIWSLILLGATTVCLIGGSALLFRRASHGRRELSQRLHEAALGLDRRCDVLQEQISTLDQRQRIDHLFELVAHGEAESLLDQDVARRLRRFALDLRSESFASGS